MRIWLISDTHFYHAKMVEYCGRPINHTELIIKNWILAPAWDDLTIHLGDVIFGNSSKMKGILAQVPGKKVLIKGNHDRESLHWYMENGFDFACNAFIYKSVFFTHTPAKVLPEGTTINVHGHFHNAPTKYHDFTTSPINKLLAIEYTDYKPVLLENFVEGIT